MDTGAPCRPSVPLTRRLAARLAAIVRDGVPAEARAIARLGLTDCVGVLMGGCGEPAVGIIAAALAGDGGPPESLVLPTGERSGAARAALVNGAAAHVLDFDDVALDGHLSAVLVPALLALGEAEGATAEAVLTGYVAGYEVWAALRHATPARLHARGWHPSGVFGSLAAAAACGVLLRLDQECFAHLLGIAAAEAGGLAANFGAMAKCYQVGRAARAGVVAARLAAAGLTAAPDSLEHPGGFLAAFAGAPPRADETSGWAILAEGLTIKMYPMCFATHRVIDAVLEIRPSLGEVDEALVRIGRTQLGMLRNHAAKTGLEARFSLEFAVAAALVAGQVGPAQLTDDFVAGERVQALMGRVRAEPLDDLPGLPASPWDQVVVTGRDGRIIESRRVTDAGGSPACPPSPETLWRKFDGNARARLTGPDARALFERLQAFDGNTTIAQLWAQNHKGGTHA